MSTIRTRWAALGAAVAITLGGGGIGLVSATQPDGASTLVPITPCRVIDTRPAFNVGPKASPLAPGETHTVSTHGDNGDCTGIPADAVAASMNVTAVDATAPTFLTIWATGDSQPTASSLNPTPGQPPAPNAVTTDLSAGGQFDIFNLAGNVHVLADINGYYVDHHHDDRYYSRAEIDVRAPRTEFISVGSAAFVARLDSLVNRTVVSGGAAVVGGPQDWGLSAPIHLPHGANIVGVTASFVDDSDEDLVLIVTCENALGGFRSLFSVTTSGADAFRRQLEMTQVSDDVTVDNTACAHTVIAFNSRWSTVGDDLAIQHVVVEVELPG